MSTVPARHPQEPTTRRDWRIWFGLASTLFWLWLGLMYIALVIGWQGFVEQPAEAMGGFLEGAFAPLAFLWLVIGFFMQQRELRENNRAIHAQYEQMQRAAENAEIQSRAISANERHQHQETVLLVADRVNQQLGAVIGLLWMCSFGPGNEQAESEELVADLWSRVGSGDPEAFGRQFMGVYYRHVHDSRYVHDLFFGTQIRTRHSETILKVYSRLLERVEQCDDDGLIAGALLGSANGTIYRVVRDVKAAGAP